MTFSIPDSGLESLEEQVQEALDTVDEKRLTVLGYGEVTLVLELETEDGSFACKRLPVFPTRERFHRYERLLGEYVEQLENSGIKVAETKLWHKTLPSGKIVGYCVQRTLPTDRLCSNLLRSEGEAWAKDFFDRFLDHVESAARPSLGIDAQASNWVDLDGELLYLDVTTPLMRDSHDRELLDVRLFFSSLPWLLRDAVRLSMSKSIFEKFYATRGVTLDFLGNLHKEGCATLVPGFLEQVNPRLESPLTVEEVATYYKDDARRWEVIQRLRRADRFWQRRIRRRTYPFLLQPDIVR